MSDSPWIIETSDDQFGADVFERSHELPVVVDFWAPWCQPCRMLAPVLEKLATEMQGKFLLVKANTDQLPQAAAQFAVQSIPAVYGVREGQVVDFFVGALPEAHIRQWLQRLLPSEVEQLVAEARVLGQNDRAAAEAKLREALGRDPNSALAAAVLAELLLEAGRVDECRQVLQEMEDSGISTPELQRLGAELDLRQAAQRGTGVQEAQERLAAEPNDPQRQLELAQALAVEQRHAEALEIALTIVQSHRGDPVGDKARRFMVDLFRLLPEDSELVSTYRRRLSTALY